MTKNRDWRLEGLENYGTFQPFSVSGKFEIPAIAPVTELKPLEWRCFGEQKRDRENLRFSRSPKTLRGSRLRDCGKFSDTGIHFFTDDYRQRDAGPKTLRVARVKVSANNCINA